MHVHLVISQLDKTFENLHVKSITNLVHIFCGNSINVHVDVLLYYWKPSRKIIRITCKVKFQGQSAAQQFLALSLWL